MIELILEIGAVTKEPPIIVGSQTLHAITTTLPDIVRRSIECDFLLIGNQSSVRQKINQDFGVFSSYQQDKGFYADALGLATVVLPDG